jgi:hypothetical protein
MVDYRLLPFFSFNFHDIFVVRPLVFQNLRTESILQQNQKQNATLPIKLRRTSTKNDENARITMTSW